MKQLTITIPDYYYQTFMEYFTHIPEASLLNESSFVLDDNKVRILDQRAQTPDDKFISIEESNIRLGK